MTAHKMLAVIGLLCVVVVLGGGAYKALKVPPHRVVSASSQPGPMGLQISDLPLSRAFQVTFSSGPGTTIPLPPGIGIAITDVSLSASGNSVRLWINGTLVSRYPFPGVHPTAPVVLLPGSTLLVDGISSGSATIGGYFFLSGEL